MHVEKGVFESTISLLLDIPSKTKDGLNAHKYLQALEIRKIYIHKKDRIERLIFLQLVTPSQLRTKGQFAGVYMGSEPPQDSQQT
jgi:hypothetical protein